MKNRSHRLSTSDHHDDWVDGSWTVDCVCGVNFDDGEEMVNCDECGVWVHTRCSRYVKSEKLFACDKCKNNYNNNNNNNNNNNTTTTRNDSEETEVAQLLVELPTKTLRMDNPYPPVPSYAPPHHRPSIIDDRVHVQGIPGGDPSLFASLSSVFTPQLWKCTGYVPKKFNFQYREFPCLDGIQQVDGNDDDPKMEEEYESPVDNGAGVLFSLSKENVPAIPVPNLVGMKGRVEEGVHDRVAPPSIDSKKSDVDVEDLDARRCQSSLMKKDRSLLRPSAIQSTKRKRVDLGTSKDRSGKKVRVVDKEGESKQKSHASRTASTLSSDAKQLVFNEDRGPKVLKTDTQRTKNGNGSGRDCVPGDHLGDGYHAADSNVDKVQNHLASCDQISEVLSSDVFRHGISVGATPEEDMVVHHISSVFESSFKADDGVSLLQDNDSGSVPIKEEVVCLALDKSEDGGCSSRTVGVDSYKLEPLVEDLASAEPEAEDNRNIQDSNGDMTPSSLQPHVHIKSEVDISTSGGVCDIESSPPTCLNVNEMKPSARHLGISVTQVFENIEVSDEAATNSQSSEPKLQDVERSTEAVNNSPTDKADELPGPSKLKRQLAGLEDSMSVRKTPSEPKHSLKPAEEPSKSGGLIFVPSAPPSQRKVMVSIGKSCSNTPTATSKSSISDNGRPANFPNHNPAAKQRGISDSNFCSKKDNSSTDIVRDEDGREMPQKIPKEHPKSSILKMSHSTKTLHASVSKRTSLDSKDPVLYSSSKASSAQNVALTSGSGESANTTQTQSASHAQNKITFSGLPQKGEKVNQLSSQPSSKVNNTPIMHPPATLNSAAALSDEELALLLHQELNSSPRVPRVPRMRHAGSLPQLASPTASSMLMKRTSSPGGKDHSSISRRKSRDPAKDGSHSSRELDHEAKKIDIVTSSPDRRKHVSMCTTDPTRKREVENGFGKGVHPVKKSIPPAPTGAASSGLSSSTDANEQNLSSTRNSPRNASDDDTGTIRRPAHITLPGLIDGIMSKGKRTTYEELCNAVLPHWPNLRKHNGERYAYSSHLQAVLDCLRNRHEWASLIDRGPKTNASRKRRKLDAELPSFESEDNEYAEDRNGKDVERKSLEAQREEFPKGKRKARKRRRLALQGRGIKDFRRRRKEAIMLSDGDDDDNDDEDVASFSSSSEESMFSGEDDELEGGGGTCPVAGEASASSDETGTMQ